jgi:integrase
MAKSLTAAAIRTLRIGKRLKGGDGLFAENDRGTRYLGFRYPDPVTKRYREARLGRWRDADQQEGISMAEARAEVVLWRSKLAKGLDPKARAPAKKSHIFAEVAEEFISAKVDPVAKHAIHGEQWRNALRDHAAAMMQMDVVTIAIGDILAVLQPIWLTQNPTAARLRGRIERILNYAMVCGWRTGANPAIWRGNLEHVLAAPAKVHRVTGRRAINWRQAPRLIANLRASPRTRARMVEFCGHAATRTTPIIQLRWHQIDLDQMIWTVPAQFEKTSKPLRVPLCTRMMAILLEQQDDETEADDVVFFSPELGRKATRGINAMLNEVGDETTVHGLRTCFRQWAKAQAYPRDLAEEALSHTYEGRIEGAYTRDQDMLEQRRPMMEAWAQFLNGGAAEIIDLEMRHAVPIS